MLEALKTMAVFLCHVVLWVGALCGCHPRTPPEDTFMVLLDPLTFANAPTEKDREQIKKKAAGMQQELQEELKYQEAADPFGSQRPSGSQVSGAGSQVSGERASAK